MKEITEINSMLHLNKSNKVNSVTNKS